MDTWIKRREDPINLVEDGCCPFSSSGVQKFKCAKAPECFIAFANLPEKNVSTQDGLCSRIDPLTVKHFMNRIEKICIHPKKAQVLGFIKKAAGIQVLMPLWVLEELQAVLQKRSNYASK